jgi:hypothetical protein
MYISTPYIVQLIHGFLDKKTWYLAAKSPCIFAKLTNVKLAMKSGPSESLMFKHDFSSTGLKFKRLTENGLGVFRISFPGYVTILVMAIWKVFCTILRQPSSYGW